MSTKLNRPNVDADISSKKSRNRRRILAGAMLAVSLAFIAAEQLPALNDKFDFGPLTGFGLILLVAGFFFQQYLGEAAEVNRNVTTLAQRVEDLRRTVVELQSLTGLGDSVLELNAKTSGRVFSPLLRSRIEVVRGELGAMADGKYEFFYRPKVEAYAKEFREIIKAMLDSDTIFQTVTNTVFWSEAGINVADQYMGAMLNSLERHQALEVQRLIVIPSDDGREKALGILKRHANELKKFQAPEDRCLTRVLELEEGPYEEHFRRGGNFAIWRYQGVEVALIVGYVQENKVWKVDRIQFTTHESDRTGRRSEFDRLFNRCTETKEIFEYLEAASAAAKDGVQPGTQADG